MVEMIVTNNNLPLLSQLEPLMRAKLALVMKQIGQLLERGAKLAIQNQIAPDGTTWEALQEWYVDWKQQKGYSEQIYLLSSSYINAITWASESEGEDISTIVGVKRDSGPSSHGQEDIWRIAEILEYGWEQFNVRIPPRPLWRPLLQVNKHGIQTRVGAALAAATKEIEMKAKGEPNV